MEAKVAKLQVRWSPKFFVEEDADCTFWEDSVHSSPMHAAIDFAEKLERMGDWSFEPRIRVDVKDHEGVVYEFDVGMRKEFFAAPAKETRAMAEAQAAEQKAMMEGDR